MTDGMLFSGKTVEDAVAEGLRSLRLTQEQVEIEVLNRGSRGLFGIGSEPAQVRLTPRPAQTAILSGAQVSSPVLPAVSASAIAADINKPGETLEKTGDAEGQANEPAPEDDRSDENWQAANTATAADTAADTAPDADEDADEEEIAALAVELLSETVRHIGFDAEVLASWQEPDADNDERYLLLDLHGRDLGALIGRRGETLSNLQYLLRLMVNQRLHQWKNIVVDVEQYRQRRAEHLVQLALRSADQVANSGRALSLEPMPPNERRIIHLALRDHASVFTESSGEGERRKIQILPKRS